MPEPKLIPLVDWRRGSRDSPSFQRGSQGAPLDLLNIEVDGQNKPYVRAGYTVATGLDPIGSERGRMIRVHDLGNSQRDPISRTYKLRRDESVVVQNGRMIRTHREFTNTWIDLQSNGEYDWVNVNLTQAPTYNQVGKGAGDLYIDDGDRSSGYRPGGRVVSNLFSFAMTFESVKYGIETSLSLARPFSFNTYTGGFYDRDIRFWVYASPIENQPIPGWVDKINFYMQTETDPDPPRDDMGDPIAFDPNGSDRYFLKFGEINLPSGPANFNPFDNPVEMKLPIFSWVEGDQLQIPGDDSSILPDEIDDNTDPQWPQGRGEYWRAIPTLTGFSLDENKFDQEINAVNTATVSPVGLYPIMLYAERIWGWSAEEQLLRFSDLGEYDNFPQDYALELSRSGASKVEAIHPAPSGISAFYVFKQDAIHVVRGSGQIDGLRQQSLAVTDLDTSGVIEQHGTLSPRTIVDGENGVYFISRDKKLKYLTIDGFGTTNVQDIGIGIETRLSELTSSEQKNLVAFIFNNCYHLIMPTNVLVLDIQKRYWRTHSWRLVDGIWSEGGINSESAAYGILQDTYEIVQLYEGDDDNGDPIPCEFETQNIDLPYETNVTGVYILHTSEPQEMTVELYTDDNLTGTFTDIPQKGNNFRISTYGYGHEARVKIKTTDGIPRINAILLEIP